MKNQIGILPLSIEELDKQSTIHINEWLDIDGEIIKYKDPDIALTKKWLKIGFEDKFLMLDKTGRVWGRGKEGRFFPYHFNVGKQLYGIRIAAKAAN